MTDDQLSQLKQMTPGEIARKYTPLLIRGAIKRNQFDWLVSQGVKKDHVCQSETLNGSPGCDCHLEEAESKDPTESPVSPLNASRSVETDESVDTAGQFTTHEDQALGKSQKARLLILLKDKLAHTTPEIMEKVYGSDHLGRANIPARILDLKNEGHEIECKHESGTIYSYRLLN